MSFATRICVACHFHMDFISEYFSILIQMWLVCIRNSCLLINIRVSIGKGNGEELHSLWSLSTSVSPSPGTHIPLIRKKKCIHSTIVCESLRSTTWTCGCQHKMRMTHFRYQSDLGLPNRTT